MVGDKSPSVRPIRVATHNHDDTFLTAIMARLVLTGTTTASHDRVGYLGHLGNGNVGNVDDLGKRANQGV